MHVSFCEQKYAIFVPMIHSCTKKCYNIVCCNNTTNKKCNTAAYFTRLLILSICFHFDYLEGYFVAFLKYKQLLCINNYSENNTSTRQHMSFCIIFGESTE